MADEAIFGNERSLDPAGRGVFSWTDTGGGSGVSDFFDGLFDFGTSAFKSAVDWYGTDKAYELERLRVTSAYDDRTGLGSTFSDPGTMKMVALVALLGVGAFLVIKAVR